MTGHAHRHYPRLSLLVPLLMLGCSATPRLRALPSGLPSHFLVQDSAGPRAPHAGEGCRNPLLDPSSGGSLTLVRSERGLGDYSAPPGAYALKANELLRIECATGVPVGVVTR